MTQADFTRTIRAFERSLKRRAEDEVRKFWREERGLIYVKRHVVPAYFRKVNRRPRAAVH